VTALLSFPVELLVTSGAINIPAPCSTAADTDGDFAIYLFSSLVLLLFIWPMALH